MKNNDSELIYNVIVVGAGPYGLSVAAHLLNKKLKMAIFGKPMAFWREHIPPGMLLRSRWWANSLSDPNKKYTIDAYFKYIGKKPYDPLPEEELYKYGLWFQKNAVPNIDETYITNIKKRGDTFMLTLADGRELISYAVIMATGLLYYHYRPEEYSKLPKKFVSHTSDNVPFSHFKDKTIAVIGRGQSALETATLMSEAGITVHLINRTPLEWTSPENTSLYHRLRYPRAGIANGLDNWILEHFPYLFYKLPQRLKEKYVKGKGENGAIGTYWLKPRMKHVIFHDQQRVEKVEEVNGRVLLTLSNTTTLVVDHIVLGTGYKIDVSRLPMLDKSLIENIKTHDGKPELKSSFESNVKGLYFIGVAAASSFGPLYRFVTGVDAAARRVAQAIK